MSAPILPIPIVDFSLWIDNTSPANKQTVAEALTDACRTVGFVYVKNHGLAQDFIDAAFAMSQKLFALSHEDKTLAPHPPGPDVHRGYSAPGIEKVSQYMEGDAVFGEALRQVEDVKESYEIGSEELKSQPNVWLPEQKLPGFRRFTTDFYWECHRVAQEILRALAQGLGLEDPNMLLKFHSGHNNQLRLLHYPPVPVVDIVEGRKARMEAHSDWGTVTLLFQSSTAGLEIASPVDPKIYLSAPPIPGACILNVGDLLMRWSNDDLKSTMHRVALPLQSSQGMAPPRYSIPYFVAPDPETLVECLPCCVSNEKPAKYAPITQAEYGKMRAKVQYRSIETREEDTK